MVSDEHAAAVAGLAYTTLRLPRTATPADIRHAYRRCALISHPDRPKGETKQFLRVRQAFELLNDPVHRASLDKAVTDMPLKSRGTLPALPDTGVWVERRRFWTEDEARTFVERCQPFDFETHDSAGGLFHSTAPGCSRRWRIREDGKLPEPWVAEQEGELFARSRDGLRATATGEAATSSGDTRRLEEPSAMLYLGVPEQQVQKVLSEGYRSHIRKGIPCSPTPSSARAAAAKISWKAGTLSLSSSLIDNPESLIAVLHVKKLPHNCPVVHRPDGGYLLRIDHLPPSSLCRVKESAFKIT